MLLQFCAFGVTSCPWWITPSIGFRQVQPPPWLADHSRVKQPVLIPIGSRGHVSLIRLAASLNIDTQDRQEKQDEKLVHKKLIGSIIECAFVENLSVLRGPSRIPFESFPTPWNPFADSSFALLTDPLSPLVEIFSPFPTFGGSLLSFLQPLRGPSSSFMALRGFLFWPLWITLNCFRQALLWGGCAFPKDATDPPLRGCGGWGIPPPWFFFVFLRVPSWSFVPLRG